MAVSASFLGIRIDEMHPQEALERISAGLGSGQKQRVYFVNAHCVNMAFRHREYWEALAQGELVLADGSGVLLGSRLLGLPIRHNLNGTDLVPRLCAQAAQRRLTVFLLGAEPGVADLAAARLMNAYPGLRVVGVQHGFFGPEEEAGVIVRINAARPDILLVAMGVPRQEVWITRHWERLDVGAAFAVGALFDFIAERFKRAPGWMRRLGIEWVFRLIQEPGRLWQRYLLGNLVFLARVACAALNPRARHAAQQALTRPLPAVRPGPVAEKPEPDLAASASR